MPETANDEKRGVNADTELVENVYNVLDMQKDKNIPVQSRKNCVTVLGMDPALSGKIKYNTLSNKKNVVGALPWNKSEEMREWNNIDYEYLLYYLETYYHLNSEKKILSALEMIADTNKFNPFIDMLNSVEWDGTTRICNLLPDYLGAKKNDYTTECMKLLMLGVISRAFSPGTKFDYILVVTGRQGVGKSTFFRKLCCNEEWYLENLKSIHDEVKAAEKIQGKLIVEFNELMGMKASVESVKSFTTATSDDYRPAYGRSSEKKYRTCVFVGTTNESQFLTDKTGNRRFLPVECGVGPIKKSMFSDDKTLKAEFMQAWAEAYHIYLSGKFSLILSPELAEYVDSLQGDFEVDDPKVGMIQDWLDNYQKDYVCNLIIAREVFGEEKPDKKLILEIGEIMRNKITGWELMNGKKTYKELGRQKSYVRSSDFYKTDDSTPFSVPIVP